MEPERPAFAPWEMPIEPILDGLARERARRRAPHTEDGLDAARGVLLGLLLGGPLWHGFGATAWQLAHRGDESRLFGSGAMRGSLGGPAPCVRSLPAPSLAEDRGPGGG